MVLMKDLKPATLNGKPEKWRAWVEEVADYVEANHRGLRQVLEKVEKLKNQEADEYWVMNQKDTNGDNIRAELIEEMFTVLKMYTEPGTHAHDIVMNTPKKMASWLGKGSLPTTSRNWQREKDRPSPTCSRCRPGGPRTKQSFEDVWWSWRAR